MTESLIFCLLFSQGLFCYRLLKGHNFLIVSSLNHIAGIALGSLYTTITIGFNIPFNYYSITFFFVSLLGVNLFYLRNSFWDRRLYIYLSLNILAVFLITLFTKFFNFTILSFDSYKLVHIANSIAAEGGPTLTIGQSLASWGISLISLQALAPLFSIEYLANLNITLYFSVILLFLGSIYESSKRQNLEKKRSIIICILFGLFLVSTYFFSFQAFYIHNALLSAALLLASIYSFTISNENNKNSKTLFHLSLFFLIVFALARIEAPVIAALCLYFFIFHKVRYYNENIPIGPTLTAIAIIILWEIKLISIMGSGSDISNPQRIYVLIASLISVIPILFLQNNLIVRKNLIKTFNRIVIATLVISLLVLLGAKSDHMITSIDNFKTNLFSSGDWAYSWHLLIPLSLFLRIFFSQKNPLNTFFDISLSISLVVLCLSFMRIPYRIGWGDSANRMMVHVFVLIAYFTLVRIIEQNQRTSELIKRTR